jgi:hypothetical protein
MAAAMMCAALTLSSNEFAQDTANVPHQPDKLALASDNAKQLLLLMDTDKNGKISKKEWMNFMSAEFDRLDTNRSGELDPKELLQSKVSTTHVPPSVQGK